MTAQNPVKGFSWLETARFAQKGACATTLLKVPSPCVYLMLLEADVACTLFRPDLQLVCYAGMLCKGSG